MEGWMLKRSGKNKNFDRRYFVLQDTELLWFDKPRGKLKGGLDLRQCKIECESEQRILVTPSNRSSVDTKDYVLRPEKMNHIKKWVELMKNVSEGATDADARIRAGWLQKKGQKRWFLVHGCELQWYAKEFNEAVSTTQLELEMKGRLDLSHSCTVGMYDAKKHAFVVTSTNPDLQIIANAKSEEECNEWIECLQHVIDSSVSQSNEAGTRSGWLQNKGGKRFFRLDCDENKLFTLRWYATGGRSTVTAKDKCRGAIMLAGCTVEPLSKKIGFQVNTPSSKTYELHAKTADDVTAWTNALNFAIVKSTAVWERQELDESETVPNVQKTEGFVEKNGQKRWLVIDVENGFLRWFVDKECSSERAKAKKELALRDCSVESKPSDKLCFVLNQRSASKAWEFTCTSSTERDAWVSSVMGATLQARRTTSSIDASVVSFVHRATGATQSRAMSRAATIEMKRRMTHSLGAALFPERQGALFERFMVIGLPCSTQVASKADADVARTPEVLYTYPKSEDTVDNGEQVSSFCFPLGVHITCIERTKSASSKNEIMFGSLEKLEESDCSFIILITGQQHLLYGICVLKNELLHKRVSLLEVADSAVTPAPQSTRTTFDCVAPQCYVFLTKFPFFQLHFDVLYGVLARERLYSVTQAMVMMGGGGMSTDDVAAVRTAAQEAATDITEMLCAYRKQVVPPDNQPLSFQLPAELRSLRFECPPGDEDNLVAMTCLGALFKLVSLEHLMLLLEACTLEKQVAVVSPNLGVLSAVVLALLPLMRPHVWQGAFIPIVPMHLHDALHCPVPYVMGTPLLPQQLREELSCMIVEVESGAVTPPLEAMPPLPNRVKLEQDIAPHYSKLYCKSDDPRRVKALRYPYQNTPEELEHIYATWQHIKKYNEHVGAYVKVHIKMLENAIPGTEKLDFADPKNVHKLLEIVDDECYNSFLKQDLTTQNFLVSQDRASGIVWN